MAESTNNGSISILPASQFILSLDHALIPDSPPLISEYDIVILLSPRNISSGELFHKMEFITIGTDPFETYIPPPSAYAVLFTIVVFSKVGFVGNPEL